MSIRDRWKYSTARTRISNWRNRRTLDRGRRPRTTQAADAARSSLPAYRNRVNPATGRPHRDDRGMGRLSDQSLKRMAPQRRADREAAKAPGAYRSGPAPRVQAGPAPREPGVWDLTRDGRWERARDVRVPDLTRRLPGDGRRSR